MNRGTSAAGNAGPKARYHLLMADGGLVANQPGRMADETATGVVLKAPLEEISETIGRRARRGVRAGQPDPAPVAVAAPVTGAVPKRPDRVSPGRPAGAGGRPYPRPDHHRPRRPRHDRVPGCDRHLDAATDYRGRQGGNDSRTHPRCRSARARTHRRQTRHTHHAAQAQSTANEWASSRVALGREHVIAPRRTTTRDDTRHERTAERPCYSGQVPSPSEVHHTRLLQIAVMLAAARE
jgi:hypothetical protein